MSSYRPDPAGIPPALLNPEPTADRMVRAANEALRRRPKRPPLRTRVVPGLDVGALAAKYGGDPADTKQTMLAVFRVPVGASWGEYLRTRNARLATFLRVLEAKGYRLIPRKKAVRVSPGLYPATHPETGMPMLDHREFRLEVDCSYPNAEPVLIRLDPEDVAPIVQSREGGR